MIHRRTLVILLLMMAVTVGAFSVAAAVAGPPAPVGIQLD